MTDNPVDYVSEQAAKTARAFEKRLQGLSPDSGILFVGVSAVPHKTGDSNEFSIRLGIRRSLEPSVGASLVRFVFRKEVAEGVKFSVSAYSGTSGPCRDYPVDDKADAHPT